MWELKTGKWKDEVVSMFEAHQRDWISPIRAANPTARKVLSLQQNDVIAIEREELAAGGRVRLSPLHGDFDDSLTPGRAVIERLLKEQLRLLAIRVGHGVGAETRREDAECRTGERHSMRRGS